MLKQSIFLLAIILVLPIITYAETTSNITEIKYGDVNIKIGDEKDKFNPAITFERWDDAMMKFSYDISGFPDNIKFADSMNDKIIFSLPNLDLNFYPIVINNLNGYEFEFEFKNKPLSNVIQLPIQSENLDFFYQPPLDEELNISEYDFVNSTHAIKNDIVMIYRPENVVGSYAVYHSSKSGNEYLNGKAFHIYRPKIIDAKNNEEWVEMEIKNNVLTLTIDQKFLDTATYPIVLDPSFGYTSIGGTGIQLTNVIVGSTYNLTEAGTISNIGAYAYIGGGGSGNVMKSTIYADGNSSNKTNVNGTEISTTPSSVGWWDMAVSDIELSSGNYRISVWTGHTGDYFYYDSGDTDQYAQKSESYDGFPDPINWDSLENRMLSIYANYTPTGVDSTPPTYSSNSTNTTTIGDPCLFQLQWDDEVNLTVSGGYIFSTNNSETWVNSTWTAFTTTPETATNVTILNSTIGTIVGWRFYANDTAGNWNASEIFSLTTSISVVDLILSVNETIMAKLTEMDNKLTSIDTNIQNNFTATNNLLNTIGNNLLSINTTLSNLINSIYTSLDAHLDTIEGKIDNLDTMLTNLTIGNVSVSVDLSDKMINCEPYYEGGIFGIGANLKRLICFFISD